MRHNLATSSFVPVIFLLGNTAKYRFETTPHDYLPKLSPDLEKELRAHYHDEVLELADMTGRKLDHWL